MIGFIDFSSPSQLVGVYIPSNVLLFQFADFVLPFQISISAKIAST